MAYRTVYVQECENGFIIAVPSTPEVQGTQLVAGDRSTMHAAIDVIFDAQPAENKVFNGMQQFKGC